MAGIYTGGHLDDNHQMYILRRSRPYTDEASDRLHYHARERESLITWTPNAFPKRDWTGLDWRSFFSFFHQQHHSSNFRRYFPRVEIWRTRTEAAGSTVDTVALKCLSARCRLVDILDFKACFIIPSAPRLFLAQAARFTACLETPTTDFGNITTMPRKDFRNDLNQATAPHLFPHLGRVRAGDDDESILFTFTSSHMQGDFQVIVSGKPIPGAERRRYLTRTKQTPTIIRATTTISSFRHPIMSAKW